MKNKIIILLAFTALGLLIFKLTKKKEFKENPKALSEIEKAYSLMDGDVFSKFIEFEGWHLKKAVEAVEGKTELKVNEDNQKGKPILYNGKKKDKKIAYLTTKEIFKDLELDLEFMVPKASNAGVYFMGRYEIQILDSYGVKEPKYSDLGGVYQRWDASKKKRKERGYGGISPLKNAAKAPGEWQKMHVVFQAPKFNADGIKIQNAKFVSVEINGVLVQENVEVTGPTRGHVFQGETTYGPVVIQGNHGPVAIRKYTVKSLNEDTNILKENGGWIDIFNKRDLKNWDFYRGVKGGDETSLLKKEELFHVNNGVIHVYNKGKGNSKQYNANLVSKNTYSKFHLQVEYRWLKNKFNPRVEEERDAGILFHVHSDRENVWPPSIEMQLGDGKKDGKFVTGDIFVLGNSRAHYYNRKKLVKMGIELPAINNGKTKKPKRIRRKGQTYIYPEKPSGEWNLAEVIVDGNHKAQYFLNGELVNEVFDMKFSDADGNWKPLRSGYISVQAEWAELEYGVIRVKEVK